MQRTANPRMPVRFRPGPPRAIGQRAPGACVSGEALSKRRACAGRSCRAARILIHSSSGEAGGCFLTARWRNSVDLQSRWPPSGGGPFFSAKLTHGNTSCPTKQSAGQPQGGVPGLLSRVGRYFFHLSFLPVTEHRPCETGHLETRTCWRPCCPTIRSATRSC